MVEETESEFQSTAKSATTILALTNEAIKTLPLVGDVNLFLKGAVSEEEFEAEVEIMIAGICSIFSLSALNRLSVPFFVRSSSIFI